MMPWEYYSGTYVVWSLRCDVWRDDGVRCSRMSRGGHWLHRASGNDMWAGGTRRPVNPWKARRGQGG